MRADELPANCCFLAEEVAAVPQHKQTDSNDIRRLT